MSNLERKDSTERIRGAKKAGAAGKVKRKKKAVRSRRKTYAITIDEDANIVFRVPSRTTNRQIMQLAKEKSRWIITHYLEACARKNSRPHSDLSDVQRTALENRYKEAARSYIPRRVAYYHAVTVIIVCIVTIVSYSASAGNGRASRAINARGILLVNRRKL